MSDNIDIIQSKIVGKEWDALWDKETTSETAPVPVVVLSETYSSGSAEEAQLQKMLQACGLDAAQYKIILLANEQLMAWHAIRERYQPKVVLLLGVNPYQLGVSAMFRLLGPNNFNDCTWIPAPSLTELEKQPEAKKQLWLNALKPVFVDKTTGNF